MTCNHCCTHTESGPLPFAVHVPDSGNEVDNLRRASAYIDDQLAFLGSRPAHDPWGFPYRPPRNTRPHMPSYRTVELKEVIIPAHLRQGWRIAEHGNAEVTVISVEPANPNDRNGSWLVRYQERRP